MLDKPLDPAGRGYVSLHRDFAGLTDDIRQKFRDDILSATPQKMRNVLAGYFSAAGKEAVIAAYSSQEKLQEANDIMGGKLILEHLSET
jgi:Zn-dependent M16 (insulinase) family peptidase